MTHLFLAMAIKGFVCAIFLPKWLRAMQRADERNKAKKAAKRAAKEKLRQLQQQELERLLPRP